MEDERSDDCELGLGHGGLGQSEFLLLLDVSKDSRRAHDWDPSSSAASRFGDSAYTCARGET